MIPYAWELLKTMFEIYCSLSNLKSPGLKVDTGAQGIVLPLRVYKQLFPHLINGEGCPTNTQPEDAKLRAYNGTNIPHHGSISLPCKYKNSKWKINVFYVADTPGLVILGLPSCRSLGLVAMNCVLETNASTCGNQSYKPRNDK